MIMSDTTDELEGYDGYGEVDDEHMEMLEAIGGRYGKSVWKHWKKDHGKATDEPFNLKHKYREKLIEEFVDKFIFVISQALVLGISADDIHRVYLKKNEINIQRQKDGY
jgi:NTP pyrophosphatase (non-canonical NTP hydrolase)